VRRRLHPDGVVTIIDRNINYTSFRRICTFCALPR
jgi:2-iminoacetate synthase ThiH